MIGRTELSELRVALAGLAGACFVGVTTILTLDVLDTPLKIALGCFAIALPLLITTYAEIYSFSGKVRNGVDTDDAIGWVITFFGAMFIGVLVGGLGVVALFWHFGTLYGILLLVGYALAILANRAARNMRGSTEMTRANNHN